MDSLLSRYQRTRARSRALFGLLNDTARRSHPIALRHPVVFYEGHLPGFAFNTLVRRTLGGASVDPVLERLFARGIDPEEGATRAGEEGARWPAPDVVRDFVDVADRRVVNALVELGLDEPSAPVEALPDPVREAVFTVLEHEAMHQETLMYMWHRVPLAEKRRPDAYVPRTEGGARVDAVDWIEVPGGTATLGADRDRIAFGWDNEFPTLRVDVPAFAVERWNVTNARYLAFVEDGGYATERWWRPEDWQWVTADGVAHPLFWERVDGRWYWRGMFDRLSLPLAWPVYVSQAEASAFARWASCRLLTEAEYQRAAFGSPAGERPHPWGADDPAPCHGVFDWESWDPHPVGSHPDGSSAWGVEDLVGNGWEWTCSPFAPFPGFRPMASYPEYSADFFDGCHVVMKGASPVTGRELLRPSFRNWFRTRYPYVYATFRCVRAAA